MNWKLELALISCALLGLRHGFDYDHLAAISDITAVQSSWKQGMRLGITYAVGHAVTVVTLGALVIMLHIPLPARLECGVLERSDAPVRGTLRLWKIYSRLGEPYESFF